MRILLVVLSVLMACGDDSSGPDATTVIDSAVDVDAGSRADAEIVDSDISDTNRDVSQDGQVDATEPDGGRDTDAGEADAGSSVRLPPMNGRFDYQLGGDYPPPEGISIVERDREGTPAAGLYNICYVNGYQTQPGESGDWDSALFLRDTDGDPLIDADWPGEVILDISTADKRTRIAAQLGGWIRQCAADGFDAVEIDNLDTYSRASGATVRITQDDAVALMVLLVAHAHGAGLAIAQKNSAELLGRRAELETDFVVVEECSQYEECAAFVEAYGAMVLMIEYRRNAFSEGCATYGASHAIVLRDLNLVLPSAGRYVFDDC